MKSKMAIRLVAVLFAAALFGAAPAPAFALHARPAAPAARYEEAAPAEEKDESASSAQQEKDEEATTIEDPETPQAMPGPEEPVQVGHPSSVLFTFVALLAVVALVRIFAKRSEKQREEDSAH